MARHTGKLCILLSTLYAAIWVRLSYEEPTPFVVTFLVAPLILSMVLGGYAAFSIMKGVIMFNRSQAEQDSLLKDMKKAEVALRRRGFDFEKYGIAAK